MLLKGTKAKRFQNMRQAFELKVGVIFADKIKYNFSKNSDMSVY